ncbi:NAD(P)-binding protein [Lentithecium fluviatile CBS 122367]|uniref:NAD(P)-binding protein n=1 Tax=Lentithecium fluviatile CBS 122367 TaxID=1168545 RepID=A0A6G1INZ3_9PLEO|nr:NAD(P)-binding protein [Lentithecium fluviatile CBS 122367]
MSKDLLVVFGATGNQGGSVIRYVLDDPELSKRYSIRAITRNTSSTGAQALASKGIEVVAADLDDPSSLPAALKSASFIFLTTNTQYQGHTREIETRQAKAICDEALTQGAKYIIWSSMSHPFQISGGELTRVEHFDVKAEVEGYIRGLPIKSAFFAPGSFMQNYFTNQTPRPSPKDDGTYVLANLFRKDTVIPLVDITEAGAWIAPILAEPDAYEGRCLAAAQELYTPEEVVRTMSKVAGKTVTFQRLDDEVFRGFLPEGFRDELFEMYLLVRDYGYFGEGMEEQVEEGKKGVRGKLNTLEEFLGKNDFKLE